MIREVSKMKVSIIKNAHKIKISEIQEEIKKHPFQRFEYGDFDNWVNAYMVNMEVEEIKDLREINPNAMYHYCITMKDTFKYIGNDGTVYEDEHVGFSTYYVNSKDSAFIEIDGYTEEIK